MGLFGKYYSIFYNIIHFIHWVYSYWVHAKVARSLSLQYAKSGLDNTGESEQVICSRNTRSIYLQYMEYEESRFRSYIPIDSPVARYE